MRKEIEIPKECRKITIDVEGERLIVTCSSNINSREFLCDETGEMEELPSIGDFAIFWNDQGRDRAIVANVILVGQKEGFTSNDGFHYQNAIKFRNYEQYLRVKKIYDEN